MSIFERLKAPFPPSRISWRVGSTTKDKTKGLAFGYIDARDVMQRLDEVCGPESWQNNYTNAGTSIVCNIGIRTETGDWVWKSDGAGATDVEGEKGMMSDAFKRAAVRFGIGRYLYDIPATWVEIEAAGNSYKIKQSEYARLERVLSGQTKPVPQPKPPAAITTEKGAEKQSIMPEDFAARNEFMVTCREKIEAFTDIGLLAGWWNGDEQKDLRRKHQLDSTQVEGLKQAVIKRKQFLERKAA